MQTINFWPILVAAIVSYIIGSLWYSPVLFGKEWTALVGITEKDLLEVQARGIWKLYIAQFVVTLISFGVLAFIISATGVRSVGDGALMAFLVWIGFNATDAAGKLLWEKKPLKLILIGSTGTLVSLVIGGVIMSVWR